MERFLRVNPKYPIYIISKGRWETRLTSKALEEMGVPYHIVIEPQEFDEYSKVIDEDKIYLLPFSDLGQGSIPVRNWVWDHSISTGATHHWILDDNIKNFHRYYRNKRVRVIDGTIFKAAEDFVNRYENIALSGFQYTMFATTGSLYNFTGGTNKSFLKPFLLNTRIYSCILIKNDIPYRWRGRYNEDTDLSIRVLRDGWCTVLFYAFLCGKSATMTMKGGNTDELYKQDDKFDGRYEMAKSLKDQHPDIVDITKKWGRWQHTVNYKPFAKNKLIKKPGIAIPKGINNYGMKLVEYNQPNKNEAKTETQTPK